MSLTIDYQQPNRGLATLAIGGRLDAQTAPELDAAAVTAGEGVSDNATIVLDMKGLDYISSAGLRSIAKLRRAMQARGGTVLLVNPQPQVRKVFDIVKAVPVNEVFTSIAELDAYLDTMQRKVIADGKDS
ncbi:MAG TPA: STAS domain-containing protein [Pinirhizobacter sp.]|uniref:STAS domain-containing protein n=1 Tax=Pinirhizobacter sp. TaxID=2950432 RepID=UPI002B58DC9A|nr:STAS domain-containing protein [Pinirhizobacter sp.]HMH67138.1 STAS domain-containing protein [Pinirhizobacter sp.]